MTNPWLHIPLGDYEGHMRAPGVDQLDVLATLFAHALGACRPRSVALLGVAGGNGLDAVEPAVTTRIVAIDINPAYLDAVTCRFPALPNLELHCVDLANQRLELEPVDLVHAALIFEHAGARQCLDNAVALVAEGGSLAVVLQRPAAATPAVGTSAYPSMAPLAREFAFVEPESLTRELATRGFAPVHESTHPVPGGKAFWLAIFTRRGAL